MKSLWSAGERSGYFQDGFVSEELKKCLLEVDNLLAIVSPFGGGKSKIASELYDLGGFGYVPKFITRDYHPYELGDPKYGHLHRIHFRDVHDLLQSRDLVLSRISIPTFFDDPPEEWVYWSGVYGITLPSSGEVIEEIPQFLNIYKIQDVVQQCLACKGKVFMWEITPQYLACLLRFFPNLKVVQLGTTAETRYMRLMRRFQENPNAIQSMKILESFSTPVIEGKRVVTLRNETLDDLSGAISAVLSMTRPNCPGGGAFSPSPLTKIYYETVF